VSLPVPVLVLNADSVHFNLQPSPVHRIASHRNAAQHAETLPWSMLNLPCWPSAFLVPPTGRTNASFCQAAGQSETFHPNSPSLRPPTTGRTGESCFNQVPLLLNLHSAEVDSESPGGRLCLNLRLSDRIPFRCGGQRRSISSRYLIPLSLTLSVSLSKRAAVAFIRCPLHTATHPTV
jgi:hypothetical protein